MIVKGLKPFHGGVIPSDVLYRSVCLKVRGNGTSGQTTFTDEKGHTLTQTGTGISVSTAQTKFGGGSMSFTAQAGNFISLHRLPIFHLGRLISRWTFGSMPEPRPQLLLLCFQTMVRPRRPPTAGLCIMVAPLQIPSPSSRTITTPAHMS